MSETVTGSKSPLKSLFAIPEQTTLASVGLLILRLVAGSAMMLHGQSKIQNPTGWMGPEADIPGFFQALAAISEFGGGLAWVLGLLVPLASLGILSTMAVAVYTHAVKMGDSFVASGPGKGAYEPAAIYLAMAIMFFTVGPGKLSLDRFIFGTKSNKQCE